MKKIYAMSLFALGMSALGFAEEVAQTENSEMVAQAQTNATSTMPNCSQLPADQQNFSMQLMKPANKTMFCNKFTPDQRKSAMQMMSTPGANGTPMTADQAVEQVAKKNNIMMPAPSAGQSPAQTPSQPTQPAQPTQPTQPAQPQPQPNPQGGQQQQQQQQRRGGCPVRSQ
jgi:hypothetical protein